MDYKYKKLSDLVDVGFRQLVCLLIKFAIIIKFYLNIGVQKIKILSKILLLISTLNLTINHAQAADNTLDTIIDILSGLTCETQGVGDLLRTEFSHTCIPAPFFTFAIANIVSPGMYATTMLRLKINDHELFDKDYPGGQCARSNRIDPKNPRLTFALCNNVLLAVARVEAITKSAVAIAKAVLTGGDPWDDIMDAWKDDKAKYHNIYKDKEEGYNPVIFDAGLVPPAFPIKVVKIKDTMCVATPAILADWVPVGCKYIREPYPESIYASFMDLSGEVVKGPDIATDPMAIVDCAMSSSSCYQRAYNNSQTAIVISSPLIGCIKEMTARLLVSKDVCTFDDANKIINSSKRESSVLFQFQRNMHRAVTALLTIYVIFFGFKIILSGDVPPKNEIINFVLKMVFVTYFSVGINVNPSSNSDYGRMDGMTQWAFPLLLGGIDTLAGWIMNASPSELCKFSDSDYSKTASYMSLWDGLDCRISHYLGLDMVSTLLVENANRNHDFTSFDFFSFSAPPYVYLLIPAIISGNMTLVSLALSYPLLVISVGAFMVNATVMCIISIVILSVLAPLFVPMFLFEYTRGYFESWVKLLISFLLQPMVVVAFMLMMFSVYDFGFYGHCKYNSKTIKSEISTGGHGQRSVKIFYINNNWGDYEKDDDIKSCKNSLGYMLNNPLATAFDFTKDSLNEIVKDKPGATDTDKFLSKFPFLEGIVIGPGMFFASPKLVFEKIKDITLALITACFTLYLMYHFSSQLAEFAADMTEGVSLANIAIRPEAIYKAGMAMIGATGKAMSGDTKALGGGSGDSKAIRDSVSGDNNAVGDGLSEDKVGGSLSEDNISRQTGSVAGVNGEVASVIDNIDSSILGVDDADNQPKITLKSMDELSSSSDKTEISSRALEDVGKSSLGKTELNLEDSSPKNPLDEKKTKLSDKTPREQEDHTIKQGEAGYVKQEVKNIEIKTRNAILDMEEQQNYKKGELQANSDDKTKDTIKQFGKKNIKNDGSNEGS